MTEPMKNNLNLEKDIFNNDEELYKRLCRLNEIREWLAEQKDETECPVLITILGSPRTGKTSICYNLYDFLKKSGIKTAYLEEPANEKYRTFKTDEEKKKAISDLTQFNTTLRDYALERVKEKTAEGKVKAILYDRGFLDPYVWFNMERNNGHISDEVYYQKIDELSSADTGTFNLTFVLYADPLVSIKRDYVNSLCLDERKFISKENLENYLRALFQTRSELDNFSDMCHYIDTTPISVIDTSINIAENICYTLANKM